MSYLYKEVINEKCNKNVKVYPGFRTAYELYLELQEAHYYDRNEFLLKLKNDDDPVFDVDELLSALYHSKVINDDSF